MSYDMFTRAIPVVFVGLKLTLLITCCAFLLGQLVALPLGLALVAETKTISLPARLYTFLVRGSPLLVQLFIIYYGLGQLAVVRRSVLWPVLRDPLYCCVLAIGLNSAAYTAEIIAGAIRRMPEGQFEACDTLGLSRTAAYVRVVLPQVYRAILPLTGNELVLVLKASSLASAVTVLEMTGAARAFTAKTYAPFEVFTVAGLIYLGVGMAFGSLFRWVEALTRIPDGTAGGGRQRRTRTQQAAS